MSSSPGGYRTRTRHAAAVVIALALAVSATACTTTRGSGTEHDEPGSLSSSDLDAARSDAHDAGVAALRAVLGAGAAFVDGSGEWYSCDDVASGYHEFDVDGRFDVSAMPGDAGQRALAILQALEPLGWSVSNPLGSDGTDKAQMLLDGPASAVVDGAMRGQLTLRGSTASLSVGGPCLHSSLFGTRDYPMLGTSEDITLR